MKSSSNTNSLLSIRQLAKVLRKLNVRDGDVLLVKSQTSLSSKEMVGEIIEGLKKLGHTRSLVMVVDDFNDISTMNETEMNKHGWYHMKTLLNMVNKGKKETDVKQP